MKLPKTIYLCHMEECEVFDKEGHPTGITKSKDDLHRDQDWHPGAHLWIVDSKGNILFQKRSEENIICPGKWDVSVAGHVSAGDKPLATVLREAQEEIGMDFREGDLQHLFDLAQSGPFRDGLSHNCWDTVYLAETEISISDLNLQKEEVSEAKFISYREFENQLASDPSPFFPREEEYARLLAELHRRYP